MGHAGGGPGGQARGPAPTRQPLVLANFTERDRPVAANQLRLHGPGHAFTDLVTGDPVAADTDLVLEPYRFVWLVAQAAQRA